MEGRGLEAVNTHTHIYRTYRSRRLRRRVEWLSPKGDIPAERCATAALCFAYREFPPHFRRRNPGIGCAVYLVVGRHLGLRTDEERLSLSLSLSELFSDDQLQRRYVRLRRFYSLTRTWLLAPPTNEPCRLTFSDYETLPQRIIS